MVAIPARCDAANINRGLPRLARLERNRRQHLRILREVGDVELVKAAGAEHLHADRHILKAFFALLRRNDDVIIAIIRIRAIGGLRQCRSSDECRRSKQGGKGGTRACDLHGYPQTGLV